MRRSLGRTGTEGRNRPTRAIVDDGDLATVREDAGTTDQITVVVDDGHNAVAARAHHHRDILIAAPLHAHVLRAVAKAVDLVMTDDGPAAFDNNGAVRFADDRPSALRYLAPFPAQILDPA